MVLKGFPDWIEYNNIQVAKGRSKVSWPEFQRLKRHAKARLEGQVALAKDDGVRYEDGPRSLQEALHGPSIKLLPPPLETKEESVEASRRLSEEVLELTPEMEVLGGMEALNTPTAYDASGLIGSI